MTPNSAINPLTRERERRARFCRDAIVMRFTAGEADAIEFCTARGYLPSLVRLRYRDDGFASWRFRREDAYAWAEAIEEDPHAFCACLNYELTALFSAADFRIRDSWAV